MKLTAQNIMEACARIRTKGVQPCGIAMSHQTKAKLTSGIPMIERQSGEAFRNQYFGISFIVDSRLSIESEVYYDETAWRIRCAEQRRFDSENDSD